MTAPLVELTDEVFLKLCQANPDIKFESTAQGELIVVPPTGGETGNRNLRLIQRLGNWSDADGTGLAFDSNALFVLPNNARRSPDAAWILLECCHSHQFRHRFSESGGQRLVCPPVHPPILK